MDVGSFSVGIDWKYKSKDKFGKKVSKLYLVKARCKNLKEEMLNYQHLDIDEVEQIFTKAKDYLNTEVAKSMTNRGGMQRGGKPLKLNHLICIIMYTDYTELSRDFTISFRKSHQFQLLKQIKKHNSMYYHWSKILRQLISDYGQKYKKGNGHLSELSGPFFCGMSVVLNIPQFNMFIYSPLSTSVQIQVSLKFSGIKGMVLELDNSEGSSQDLRGMDVSWISRFREEDERCVRIIWMSVCIFLFVS